jgi:hypothetical protein
MSGEWRGGKKTTAPLNFFGTLFVLIYSGPESDIDKTDTAPL